MNYSDKVRCFACKGVFLRGQTLIVQNQKGRFRVCRDCYEEYGRRKLNDDYKLAEENILKYGIRETDAYEMIKKKEKFIKQIKEGTYGRT
jgi:ribosome-binding protein aMBF1 (putative translation factor)